LHKRGEGDLPPNDGDDVQKRFNKKKGKSWTLKKTKTALVENRVTYPELPSPWEKEKEVCGKSFSQKGVSGKGKGSEKRDLPWEPA